MFSWISGPRITNVAEDLQDTTFIEPPETPAHVFPVRAFKQALFGTPHPDHEIKSVPGKEQKLVEKKVPTEKTAPYIQIEGAAMDVDQNIAQPSGKPSGILMTPGTTSKGRKTVSFGTQVVDNEGKEPAIGRSGLPANFPGKFPSPWTPRMASVGDTKSRSSKLAEALYDARETIKPKEESQPKTSRKTSSANDAVTKSWARDDLDITLDLSEPRSESGKYWKQQYLTYSENSTREMKRLVNKAKLAKNYAAKKDQEVTELGVAMDQERKKLASRNHALEMQNRDYHDQIRRVTQENLRVNREVVALKHQLLSLGVKPIKSKGRKQDESIISEDQAMKMQNGMPRISAQSPARGRRRSKSARPLSGSTRKNTSYAPTETSVLPDRPPLHELHSNTLTKENNHPPSKDDVNTSSTPAPPKPPTEVRSSPDPWVQDLYISPSKLDKLTLPPPVHKPSEQRSGSQATLGNINGSIGVSMGAKARAALASASQMSLTPPCEHQPSNRHDHHREYRPSRREYRRPATAPVDASDLISVPKRPGSTGPPGAATGPVPMHLRGHSAHHLAHVPAQQHTRRQSAAEPQSHQHSPFNDGRRTNSLMDKDRAAKARERVAARRMMSAGGGA
ncbi:hypothetical protein EJ05DRAFT_79620 [Pseudovirgaria hyperparasitica]|uniref:Spindle pole body-associated protein cut12 domain-containing protein n=1 Tax=Pseudovirgaria hyperparasitica TaxID=470096 RepID=A0A6A6W012_9PEZI|nr:uncharacterized protein EJ05DRAFT_79620 [Pseudovirgaria hyperparasitica]KAF2755845.1 hypothetical protein EJ05DRAFT_79620 [Pseudovirgaria hyperparasitica]